MNAHAMISDVIKALCFQSKTLMGIERTIDAIAPAINDAAVATIEIAANNSTNFQSRDVIPPEPKRGTDSAPIKMRRWHDTAAIANTSPRTKYTIQLTSAFGGASCRTAKYVSAPIASAGKSMMRTIEPRKRQTRHADSKTICAIESEMGEVMCLRLDDIRLRTMRERQASQAGRNGVHWKDPPPLLARGTYARI